MVRVLTGYRQPDAPTQCNLRMPQNRVFFHLLSHALRLLSGQGKHDSSVPTIPATVLNAILVFPFVS